MGKDDRAMSRDRRPFPQQRGVKLALKAMQGGGLQIARVEVHDDVVIIIPGEPDPAQVGGDRKTAEAMERLRSEIEDH